MMKADLDEVTVFVVAPFAGGANFNSFEILTTGTFYTFINFNMIIFDQIQ